ncbi:MAG: hypothetical protein KTR20_04525 [Cellvibrionaceae bacterium]|nr:hypothetical protein [Cellvibrionaceae bacterium]
MSENQHAESQQYAKKYFRKPFPPNHNPIIGSMRIDTLCNAHNALCLLRQITEPKDYQTEKDVEKGLFFLMTCIINALYFEINNRK